MEEEYYGTAGDWDAPDGNSVANLDVCLWLANTERFRIEIASQPAGYLFWPTPVLDCL